MSLFMVMMAMLIFMSIFITLVLMILALILCGVFRSTREMMIPFECGFEPQGSNHSPFSIQFFLVTVIFVIFDVEVVMLMPGPLFSLYCDKMTTLIALLGFCWILSLGVYWEWKVKSYDWALTS